VKEKVRLHLEKADACIAEAELLLSASHTGVTVSRSYYAMFHAATAALLTKEIEHSHKGIISAFAQRFVRSGPLE
jgi:uncharacterized protein (UPF0332 family)